ncbi:oxysterol binding protein [Schizosaccharomyces japonicus yFS275]|uniref:Oxysterol binding protein n=1 Tax=Schizosaccharomyces japonicus (strain yFS275 / FY16936) TaxID=402676 RepID=B6K2S0_SCHJY|nr:oxysterol binding protein [Schizosaccharomyces japonicus yFS275]EEB08560.2 oxysterol binding protein [Schizosaccharomyces japonicus yFS275]
MFRMPHKAKIDNDSEEIDDSNKNIILGLVSQLRPNMDLSRVTLPTFVLEPRSMLERITNFMSHPGLCFPLSSEPDPTRRFLNVVRFYLSGWHIRPRGVKKPLNPILGETFTGFWKFPYHNSPDVTLQKLKGTAVYVSEQVSHHPPVSAYFYMCPEYHVRIDGVLKPRSKFLGNSAASIMEGVASLQLQDIQEDYFLTQPNMYARGILFGKLRIELGDHVIVRCPKNDLIANIEFKVKGFISGTYNSIFGKVKRESTGEVLYQLSGKWDSQMFLENVKTQEVTPFLDINDLVVAAISTRPLDEQGERESRRLWFDTCEAIKARDQSKATLHKTAIEDRQRKEVKAREAKHEVWQPKYFTKTGPEEYKIKLNIPDGISNLQKLALVDDFIPVFSKADHAQMHAQLNADLVQRVPEPTNPPAPLHHHHSLRPMQPHFNRSSTTLASMRSDISLDEYHDAQLPDAHILSQLNDHLSS